MGQMTEGGKFISLFQHVTVRQQDLFCLPNEFTWVGFGSSNYSPYFFTDEEEIDLALTCQIFSSKSHMEDKSSPILKSQRKYSWLHAP